MSISSTTARGGDAAYLRRYGRNARHPRTVIHYRPRSAIREVGKALGLTEDVTARLAGTPLGQLGLWASRGPHVAGGIGSRQSDDRSRRRDGLELMNFPRHLSQHVGGFVLTQDRLDEMVPIGNAAMADRTFIEWDKDDIDAEA
jgi:error-prone DNA polymerase